MPFVPVENTVLVEMRMVLDAQQVENTLWFNFETPPSTTSLATLGAEMLDWWITFYRPLTSTETTLAEIVCTDMSSATGPQVTTTAPVITAGTLSAPVLPSNATLTVSFRTNARGRSFRGRNYIVGLTEEVNTGNTVNTGYVTNVINAYEALLSGGGVLSDGVWSVVSRYSGVDADGDPIPRLAGVTTGIVAVVVVDRTIDSQRRRLPGRGK